MTSTIRDSTCKIKVAKKANQHPNLDKQMIVLVGGMYRSGSTFTFNIAREILNSDGGVTTSLEELNNAIKNTTHKNLIIKSHTPDKYISDLVRLGASKCICSYRRPEDAIASWMGAFGFDLNQSIEYLGQWIEWHQLIKHKALNIPFEMIERHPLQTIIKIQSYITGRRHVMASLSLNNRYKKSRIKATYDKLSEGEHTENIGFSHFDKETFFHRRHVSSSICKLSQKDSAYVRDAFRGVIDASGNYVI